MLIFSFYKFFEETSCHFFIGFAVSTNSAFLNSTTEFSQQQLFLKVLFTPFANFKTNALRIDEKMKKPSIYCLIFKFFNLQNAAILNFCNKGQNKRTLLHRYLYHMHISILLNHADMSD